MKMFFLRRSNNTETENAKKQGKSAADKFESLLVKLFLLSFVTLICVQAAMFNPSFRSDFAYKTIEGEPLGTEAYLFDTCKMQLKLANLESCPGLKVLVNGEDYDSFENDTVLLELKDGDVVELDASRVLVLAEVRINAVSPGVKHLLGRRVSASGGIVPVATVYTDN